MTEIHGETAPRFAAVTEAFRRNFEREDELGAACCVYLEGEPVADLWAGRRDAASDAPWEADTLTLVFSATKGALAAVFGRLADGGELAVEDPVARFWPEFAANGKAAITLRDVLSHRAGLPLVEAELSREDVFATEPVLAAIASQAPLWKPGSAHGYHARTFGWILGEVVRRVTGQSFGRFFAEEIAARWDLELHIGLPEALEAHVAPTEPPPAPTNPEEIEARERFMGPDTLLGRVLTGPGDLAYGPVWNSRALRAAEIPSSNGIGNARALARMYAATVGPVAGERLLSTARAAEAARPISEGKDRVIQIETRFGLGFMLPRALGLDCPPPCYGHPGAGGALGFADPERRLGFGYVTNRMRLGLTGDARSRNLVRAVYSCL